MSEQRDEFLKRLKPITDNEVDTEEEINAFFKKLENLPDRANVFMAASMESDRIKKLRTEKEDNEL